MMRKNKARQPTKSNGAIRIIGGLFRGRKVSVPLIDGLRPTPNRVRETLFNWLAPHLLGAYCLDCFGGSGALSFEAISRGAASVTMLENSRDAVSSVKKISAGLKITALNIVYVDALQWLTFTSPTPFDIVFIDPPFHQGLIDPCCALLESRGWLKPDAFVYIEHEHGLSISVPSAWQCHRTQRAGEVSCTLYRRCSD